MMRFIGNRISLHPSLVENATKKRQLEGNEMHIYPSPAVGQFTVNRNDYDKQVLQRHVLNPAGQMIHTQQVKVSMSPNVNTDSWSNGI